MKKIISLLLCILMLSGILAMPVSALSYYVSHYEEAIYAGGVVDLYAYPSEGDPEDYTYQWQYDAGFGDEHWYDIEENSNYSGTKTNHLRMYTSIGNYDSWEEIPFQCVVTASDGTVRHTDNIYMYIYPTDKLIPNMKNWGYGLYTPSITNVTDLYTKDDVNYTASTCAGTNLKIFCGSKSVDDKPILRKSEVALTTEIHITENGKTTSGGNSTSYIPYTVGKIQVQIKEKLTIGGSNLGYFDTKTIDITVAKPKAISTGAAKSDCSLLRYTYNESQKLASIPKGTSLEIVGEEGSYYQVYYNGYVGYVGKTLLSSNAIATSRMITNVDVTISKPVAGQTPDSTCTIDTTGCELYKTDPITWTDTSGKLLKATDKFQEGQKYTVSIWVAAKSGYEFQTDAYGKPKLTGAINGDLPPFINKAYEQDPKEVIELTYTFASAQKAPEATEPPKSTTPTEPAHTHTISDWRTTGAYHYKACTTCGEFLEQEDHKGGAATCSAKGKCSVCGYEYIEENENHTPDTSKWIARGEMYHFHACRLCGAHCDTEDHRWSPTYLYQDKAGHAWICADCKAHSDVEPHNPGPAATETTPQTCKDCGYIITPAKNHKHDLQKVPAVAATCTQPGNIEYYTCTGCMDCFTDPLGKNKLPEDRSVELAPLGHQTSDTWKNDKNYHWRTCSVCKEILEETRMVHEPANGPCATCGYDPAAKNEPNAPQTTGPVSPPPADPDTTSDGMPGWALLLISLLAVGVGVGAGYGVLTRKKKSDAMKKKICLLLCLLLLCTLALPAVAAGSEPKITLQPQNYHYPQYSVAIYTVKAEGQNLHATWYLSYEGKTYNLSDNQNSFEPWEAYAGENYGPMEQGPNTFSWFFGGIEDGLNGAEIWCVIEDGHYDVTSQRAIITVQGSAMPPEILQMPASLTVNRGAEAELRCVARSNSDAQLCFQWYETATGKLWDIRALDGEDSDYIFCSTESPGTRYYVCCVSDSNGGLVYSSVVPVTVLDSEPQGNPPTLITKTLPKGTVGEDYGFTLETDDYAAEFSIAYNPGGANDFEKTGLKLSIEGIMMGRLKAAGTYTFTVCVSNQYGEGYGVLTLEVVDSTSQDEVPTTTPETTAETTPETTTTLNTSPAATPTAPPATTPAATQPQTPDTPDISAAFPWWGYLLIVLGGIVTGIGIAFIFVKLKKKT